MFQLKKKIGTKVASTRALALNREAVLDFVNGKKTFFHKSYKNEIVPYLLPLDQMDKMCYCGQLFSNASGSSIRKHLSSIPKQCKQITGLFSGINEIQYQSKRYHELKSNPEYMFNTEKKRVVLQIHPETTVMACICGKVNCFDKLLVHMKHCQSIDTVHDSYKQKNQNIFRSIPSEIYSAKPTLQTYFYFEKKEEMIVIENLKLEPFPVSSIDWTTKSTIPQREKDRRKFYEKLYKVYFPFGKKSAKFIIP